ncbi:MAG: hypothetical protein GYA12_12410, partial [Chloroflexi bacterium]|nr:hypothetical protein [Chloroflexota bacterium]
MKREYFPTEAQYITEKDAEDDARIIGAYLQELGFNVAYHPGNSQLPAWLRKTRPDLILNLVDSVK